MCVSRNFLALFGNFCVALLHRGVLLRRTRDPVRQLDTQRSRYILTAAESLQASCWFMVWNRCRLTLAWYLRMRSNGTTSSNTGRDDLRRVCSAAWLWVGPLPSFPTPWRIRGRLSLHSQGRRLTPPCMHRGSCSDSGGEELSADPRSQFGRSRQSVEPDLRRTLHLARPSHNRLPWGPHSLILRVGHFESGVTEAATARQKGRSMFLIMSSVMV